MAQLIATTEEQWETFFREVNIPEDEAKQYSEIFHANRMTFNTLHELTKKTYLTQVLQSWMTQKNI